MKRTKRSIIGRKGGRAVVRKYGKGHMKRIGRKGGRKVALLVRHAKRGCRSLRVRRRRTRGAGTSPWRRAGPTRWQGPGSRS